MPTSRIEAFSDGVFAVAITLLILEIKVPVLMPGTSLLSVLWPLWPKFLAYIVSFALIGIFWVGHHIMFHYIKKANRTLLWLNTLFLMVISSIPFAAALIGEHTGELTAIVYYGTTLFVAAVVFNVIWRYASFKHRLITKHMSAEKIRIANGAVTIAPAIYLAAIILAFIDPDISKAIYILTPILYIIPGPIDKLTSIEEGESMV